MWNYSFMFPSMLVLSTLLCFYFTKPRLPIRMNRTFLGMLILEIMIMVSDILSSKADENYQMFPPAVLYVLNTLFFVLYFTRIFLFFRFTFRALRMDEDRRVSVLFDIPFLACVAVSITSFMTGAIFSIEGDGYHSGPLYPLLYYCALFYILAALGMLLIHRQRLKTQELAGCIGYNAMLLVGSVLRRLFPRLLLMNTFSLVALLIIYLIFGNPDLYLSDRGHSFNMRGFSALLNEFSHRRNYHILSFVLRNYTHERSMLGGEQTDKGIALISQYVNRAFPTCLSFYLRGGRFALVGPASLDWVGIRQQINARFQEPWIVNNASLYLGVGFVDIKPQTRMDSADRIINNLTIALEAVGRADTGAAHDQVMDSENIQHLDEQADIMRSLEQAIQKGAVEVFLQPVYDSGRRVMVAAEALARIRDAEGRIIPPGLFIPIAEQNGYIDRLGEIVFEKTCAFIRDNDMDAMNLGWINVNLSPIQCMQRDLTPRLNEILRRYGVSAGQLRLEVTEQSMIDYSLLRQQIVGLRDSGFQFVLDDYGSGYSNLTRVKQYPFVNIKLDMEVVWDYFRDRDSLLPNVVEGFKRMGLSVTAEGIETAEMADALCEIGCDYLQGFLFDKPLPIDVFLEKYGSAA